MAPKPKPIPSPIPDAWRAHLAALADGIDTFWTAAAAGVPIKQRRRLLCEATGALEKLYDLMDDGMDALDAEAMAAKGRAA